MRLKELQKASKKTAKENAEKLGLPLSTYNNYINEKREPDINTQIKIADYFNVSLDYLCGRNFGNDLPMLSLQEKEAIKMFCSLNDKQKNLIYGEIKICYMQNQI